jgi:type IX secretion system PorP/SprF family membrane protein
MAVKKILWMIAICVCTVMVQAQDFALPNPHFFNNRYALNPSLAGSLGYGYLALNYRKQNIGDLPGTPHYAFAAFDVPFEHRKNNLGVQLYGKKAGLFTNSFFAVHYAMQMMPAANQRIRFGFGGGVKFSMLDTKLVDVTDPILQGWKNKKLPLFQAGISYNIGNFWAGASLQDVLYQQPAEDLKQTEPVTPFKRYNAFMAYRFVASDELFFETALLHRSKEYNEASIELNAMCMLQNKYWLAASYRNDIGATIMAGVKISGFLSAALGYKTTDFTNKKSTSLSNPAYDILMGFHFGNEETAKEEWVEKTVKEKKVKEKKTKEKIDTTKKDTTKLVDVRVVTKGKKANDLNYDYYVVVGVFSIEANAQNYTSKIIKDMGINAQVGYNSVKNLYYVYCFKSSEYEPALQIYQNFRGTNQFGDIWILRIVK